MAYAPKQIAQNAHDAVDDGGELLVVPSALVPWPSDKPLVLVGLMGAGKSSVGRRLATLLNLPFFDADIEIENAAGRTVAEIFQDFGEEEFRNGEQRVIARLLDGGKAVIATGGGAMMRPETCDGILEKAVSVWLDAPIGDLIERATRRNNRPLLANDNPSAILRELKEKRDPTYAKAALKINSGGMDLDGSCESVMAALEKYFNE